MRNAVFILNVAIVGCLSLSRLLAAADTNPVENAIRSAAKDFAAAYDRGDADAVAAHWANDGEYSIGANSVKGRPAIARLYTEFLRANPGSKMDVKIDSIRALAPTVAIEQGTAVVRNSSNGTASSSAYTAIHVKQGDKWLMTSVRESEIPSAAGNDLTDLSWLVGAWNNSGDAAKVEMNYRWMANKHFLRGDVTVTPGGKSKGESTSGGTQIIGKDPQTGRIVSWYFNADGGIGYGQWSKAGNRWLVDTLGMSASGSPTSAVNILQHAGDNVASWISVNRTIGDTQLPDANEVVIERVESGK